MQVFLLTNQLWVFLWLFEATVENGIKKYIFIFE
jgi:hypothetical protein